MPATLLCIVEESGCGLCPVELTSLKCVVGGRVWTGNKKSGQLYEMDGDNDNDNEESKIRWYDNVSCGGIQEVWSGKDSPGGDI